MINKELNCKWHFDPQAKGNEKGPNNPTALTFKGTKYHSLIRESIQNSLDAVEDKTRPVTVSFDYREFSGLEFPEFFTLKEHIQGCLDKYPNDENAKKLFIPMLDNFSGFLRSDQNIGYLRIVDSNTTGMHYDVTDPKSAFNAFISEGIVSKPNGAGGAFGFGKAVFWMLSPISTVFVSSKTDDEVNFEGQSKLCTHYIEDGHDLSPNGLYDTDGKGEVITDETKIPEYFRPKQKGTSVFVLGVKYISDEIKNELIEAVLRNFWMAIYRNKLIVKIEDVTIDKEHLSDLMNAHFDLANTKKKEIFEYNPRFFFNIIEKAEDGIDGYKVINDSVEMNGKQCPVLLYLHKQQDAAGQFVFMRSPLMTVYSEKFSSCKGADGVFICESEDGNNHLREMEDCSHDSWSRPNYEARGNTPSIVATHSLNAIKDLIRDAVRNELQHDAQETEQVAGLDKILTITTPKGADDESHKDDIVDPDNIFAPKKKPENKKNPTPTIRKARQTKAKFDVQGRLLSNSGGKKKKRPIKPGPVKPGTLKNKSTEDENGKLGIYAVPIDVSYRTWSQTDENNTVWHIIRVFSDTEIDNALIQLYGVDEEGKSLGLNIEEAPGFEIRNGEEFVDKTDFVDSDDDSKANAKQVKNALGGVHINANIPLTIKVRFNSDIKYSLRINSDRIETSNESK
ncbi:hypothetical protein [Prevotella sp. P3-122]|uniref:hypothetical protein n=1 Tax=Prevotella sp. P3-122 TaxID=2024223 RepID=UPI000B95F68F|nr:hypothetical protein [Prevotella sp. P3-122]OYP61237.1 hypothetical protein CIL02_06655 [Prevotella sp. P3-122]